MIYSSLGREKNVICSLIGVRADERRSSRFNLAEEGCERRTFSRNRYTPLFSAFCTVGHQVINISVKYCRRGGEINIVIVCLEPQTCFDGTTLAWPQLDMVWHIERISDASGTSNSSSSDEPLNETYPSSPVYYVDLASSDNI